MRKSWINTLALAATLSGASLLFAQGGKSPDQGPPRSDKEEPVAV